MNRYLSSVLFCAALLTSALTPGCATAADDQPNKFNEALKHDIQYTGSLTAIDTNAPAVTVSNKEKGPMTFSVARDCMFFSKHKKGAAALANFKVGEEVRVLYKQEGSAVVCEAMWEPGSDPSQKEHVIQK